MCVGVEKGFFEKTLLWVVELTDEWKIESRNEGHFEASIINSVCIDGDRSPNVQIVMIMPV